MTTLTHNAVAPDQSGPTPEAFQERVLTSLGGFFDIAAMYLGHRLGLYRVLAASGPCTPPELAERAGIDKRYAREWLEQQTVSGVLAVRDDSGDADSRRYNLPAGPAAVLTDTESLDYLAPISQIALGAIRPIEQLLEAYRTGGGVPFSAYGREACEGQEQMNRAMYLQLLGGEWLPAIADVHERLSSSVPARVADLGCGCGWSSIGIAKAYPNAVVDGFDLDSPSVERARDNAESAGVAHRVAFHCRDAADAALSGRYDLVIALECIHDMGRPVEALKTMRRLAGEGGAVIVVDERVGDEFSAEGGPVEAMMYGWSILHCLPVGIADCDGCGCAATGTVMRTPTLRRYAERAGFSRLEVLPIDNFFFRFYRLHG